MKKTTEQKPRLLTGDTPTGKLHLGHWVGSLENRVAMQRDYDCYFILANMHAFTTRASCPQEIRQNVLDITLDYLAAGIDPHLSTIFIQTEVPAIAELTFLFSMLVPYPRLMRNPTLKDEIRDKQLGDNYPFGFLLYPIGQVADILAFRAQVVPVGEDQLPLLELAREVARRFNQLYCGVDPHTADENYVSAGGLFPLFQSKLGRTKRLVGLGGPGAHGQLLKMSKSLNNAIYLSDDNDTVYKKVMSIYTDPHRIRATDPGKVEENPLWIFHDAFNPDKDWVEETKMLYQQGGVGDVVCKKKLVEVIIALLEPMHERRKLYSQDETSLLAILREGTARANVLAEDTLKKVKQAIHQDYFLREFILKDR
ncbi:MAG: tryptophan--tRNA ligase [Gammaproteobacteria bacterium]|nr:tryptophan--tRNA ligase [Gammaproteobacteria bacterium]